MGRLVLRRTGCFQLTMSEIGNNVYLILEIVKVDKSGLAYNLFTRASKPFYEFITKNKAIGAQIRDSFLAVEHWNSGSIVYKYRGECHRIDGPAFIRPKVRESWLYMGHLHRTALVEDNTAHCFIRGRRVTKKAAGDTVDFVDRRRATRFEPY